MAACVKLILALAAAWVVVASPHHAFQLPSSAFAVPGTNATYDYVVVGGGTAGLAIAARLAETASVAVVEAGGIYQIDNGNQSVVPFLGFLMPFLAQTETYRRHPLMDWDLVTAPLSGAAGRRIHYAQGKTLGGSSAINSMGYHRGTKGVHKRWAEAVGDDSYLWENVLPYFRKGTSLTPPNLEKRATPNSTVTYDASVFGNGPVQVSYSNYVDPTATWLARAVQAIGLPLNPKGLSSGILAGFGAWSASAMYTDATRCSSMTSYLSQATKGTGLIVYPHTQAIKIVIDPVSKRATGVDMNTAGLRYRLSARKEVIVSAGVFHSPQLLMVSGIGPRATLEKHQIPVISDLPGVGQNLWDQVFFDVLSLVNTPNAGSIAFGPATSAAALREYQDNAAGPLSYAGGYLSFERLPRSSRPTLSERTKGLLARYGDDWPELEYIVVATPGPNGTTRGNISGTLQVPASRGNVTITSASMADKPVIDLGWFTDPADAEVSVAAFKRCRQAWAAPVLGPIKVGEEVAPGPGVGSDADIMAYIRRTAQTIWHASSTCSMGKKGDRNAVVDSKARVFGVQGLRVVDASVFPFSIPGHPHGTVYMLAEKIADEIKRGK